MNDEISDNEEELVFHYKKGSFRNREQSVYSDIATGKSGPAKGFFKVLVSTKGNKMMLFTMLMCMALFVFLSFFREKANAKTIHDVNCVLSSFSFDGSIYTSLEFKKLSKSHDNRPARFSILFECLDFDGNVVDKLETFSEINLSGSSPVHAVFSDFDIKKIRCSVSCGNDEVSLESVVVVK